MLRLALAALGGLAVLNGAVALLLPEFWYASVPGVTETGPYNSHFVRDIGAAALASGGGLLATAWKPGLWPAGVTGGAFLVLHALIHVAEAFGKTDPAHLALDFGLVIVPSLLALWLALAARRLA